MVTRSPAFRNVRANSGITFRPDADTVLWLPGQKGPFGSQWTDESGNKNHGAITGATWVQPDKGIWMLSFDGADDMVIVTDAPSIQNIFDGGGTIIAYVNPAGAGEANLGVICCKISGSNLGYFFHIINETANVHQIRFWYNFSTQDGRWRTISTELPEDVVSQVAVTYDADSVDNDPIIYVNGISVAFTEDLIPIGTRGSDVGVDLNIGNDAPGGSTWDGLIGLFIAETRIWTAGQIKDHHRQHRGLFGV